MDVCVYPYRIYIYIYICMVPTSPPAQNLHFMIDYSGSRYCKYVRNVCLTFTRGRAPLDVHTAPFFSYFLSIARFSIFSRIQDPRFLMDSLRKSWIHEPPEYSRIFYIRLDPRFPSDSFGKSWIQPNIEHSATFGHVRETPGSKIFSKNPEESWIRPNVEYSAIFRYKVSKKVPQRVTKKTWIQPNVECWAIFWRLLHPRFHQRDFGKSWIQPKMAYSTIFARHIKPKHGLNHLVAHHVSI